MLLAPPLFYPNFGVFALYQIGHVGASQRISLKLLGREVIFEEFQIQPIITYVNTVPVDLPEVRHRQTDRRYTESIPRAVHSIVQEKKSLYHEFEFMMCRPTS